MEILDTKISRFENKSKVTNPQHIKLSEFFNIIKTPNDTIIKCQKAETKDEIDRLKNKLKAVTPSGTFSQRAEEHLLNYSGIICLDFDLKKSKPTIYECRGQARNFKEQLRNDEYIFAAFISPSGTGVKAFVRVLNSMQQHKKYFKAMIERFDYLDPVASSVATLCFDSYDPDIYINISATVWDILPEENLHISHIDHEPIHCEITDENEVINYAEKIINKTKRFVEGYRNQYIFSYACLLNKFGISKNSAESACRQYICKDFTANEIKASVNSAYKHISDHGTFKYESPKVKEYIFQNLKDGKTKAELKKHLIEAEKYSIDAADAIVEKLHNKLFNRKETFWKITFDKKGDVQKFDFIYDKYLTFLNKNGFWKYRINLQASKIVRIIDNVITEVITEDIKEYTLRYVRNIPDETFDGINKDILLQHILKGCNTYFSDHIIKSLPELALNIHQSTATDVFLYYLNGVIKVTENEITLLNYNDISGYVWKDRIVQREIKISENIDCDYSAFLKKISHNDDHLKQIISCIGYLLNPFKTESLYPAIIFTDEIIDENANGGTGKGLIMKGIEKLRKTLTINGKNFSFDKTFAFQGVDLDTNIIFFDDVQKSFDFERLFSVISEGITVEKKNQNEFFIPFKESPKVVVASNYILKGEGSSFERRRKNIELKNYFNSEITPEKEFGRMLFNDWDLNDWNAFDNFMINCVQFYIKNSLVKYVAESEPYKNLIRLTSLDFIDFCESIIVNEEHCKDDYFEKFRKLYSIKWNKINKFSAGLKLYCNYKGYELLSRYSAYNSTEGKNYFTFKTENYISKQQDECPY